MEVDYERMSKAKIAKAEKKAIWMKKIMYAKMKADEAIKINPSDELLCCNLDSAMIKKEKDFTYAEIIQIFNECGESAFQLSGLHQGWLLVGGCHGVAEKNTLWAKTFAHWLAEQGFQTSMWYQLD